MSKQALVVIDVQNLLVENNPYLANQMIQVINDAIQLFKSKKLPIIFVQHTDEELVFESKGWQISSLLDVTDNDIKVQKNYNSIFKATELEAMLQANDIDTLVMCGMQCEFCVDTSIKVAFEKGYNVQVIKDSVSTFDSDLSAKQIIDHYMHIWSCGFAQVIEVSDLI